MIQSCAINKNSINAMKLFDKMKENTNMQIDLKIYVTISNALSHGNMVNKAKYICQLFHHFLIV